ncbi:MAG: hypothetical protein KC646_03235 [Candidatus Cloacimonetes bacterium]|nr:hypothetical protein [Candidatus Cloacimonadota bacterium]
MLSLNKVMLLKNYYISIVILNIIIAPTLNAQNNNIVYETVQSKTLTSKGRINGFRSQNLYAFATPYLKAFSLKTKGLVDFETKVRVKNSQFSLPFLDHKKQYIYGIFHDKNKNGLLDLYSEPFYFAQNIDGQLVVNKRDSRTINIKVLDADDSKDIGVRVFDFQGKLLFTRQFSSSNIKLEHLPSKSHFKLYSTVSMDDHAISLTEEGIHYDISSYLHNNFVVSYGSPWSPLDLEIEFNKEKYYLTLTSLSKSKTITLNDFHLYDMPQDQYYISMKNKTTNENVLVSPTFHHPSAKKLQFEFSNKYFVEFAPNVMQKKCKIFQNDKVLYQGGNPSKLELMQPGQYLVHIYDKVKRAIRKKNKYLLKNFESYQFSLNQNSPDTQIFSLLPNYKEVELSVQLFNKNTQTSSEGQLIVFQRKENETISNLIHFTSLAETSPKGMLKVGVNIDPEQILFLHFDFNSNFTIDDSEEEYVRGFQWKDLSKVLSLPQIKEGFLELSANTTKANPYFVNVTNTIDDSVLVSNYISKKVVSYQNLPIEVDLKIDVVYDLNGDEVPGEGDHKFPSVYTRIRANTQIEKVVMDLNEK